RFGPVHMPSLVHPLKPGHTLFLVELRALGEISDAVKIPQLEYIGPTLSPGGDDLGGDDFREVVAAQILPKIPEQRGLHAEDMADRVIPHCEGTIFQQDLRAD